MSGEQEGQQETISASQFLDEIIPEWVHPLERGLYLSWIRAVTPEPPMPNLPELPDARSEKGIAKKSSSKQRRKKS